MPLTTAKINRPSAEGILPRERLFAALDKGRKKPAIWISGPGGAGKTNLISSYIESRQLSDIWCQLDQGDADVASFFYYLRQASLHAAPQRKKPLPLLTPEYLMGLTQFTLRFFEELFTRMKKPGLLVLDGFQEVPEQTPFQRVILDGISRVPRDLSVVIISRRDPPPAYSSLRAKRKLTVLGWEDLRFTLPEFTEVAKVLSKDTLTPETIKESHAKLEGWIAGLILILEQMRLAGSEPHHFPDVAQQEVFDFFAGEIWSRAAPEMRDFLVKTAFLPIISLRVTEELTGISRADKILSYLCDHNLFTLRLSQSPPRYRYHSMFQEFLLHKARETFNSKTLRSLKTRTAEQLIKDDQVESAARLLIEAELWDELSELILTESQKYIVQGRFQTILTWLEALPKENLDANPWLKYWLGNCALQIGRPDAKQILTDAHEAFATRSDIAGMWLSWSAIVGILPYQWGNYQEIGQWIDRFFQMHEEYGDFPTEEIEIQAVHGILWLLVFLRPFSEEIEPWVSRARALLDRSIPTEHAVMLYNVIACYLVWNGRINEAKILTGQLAPSLGDPDVSPLPRLLFSTWLTCIEMFSGNTDRCIDMVEKGLEEATSSGVMGVDANLCAQAVYAALSDGDVQKAQSYLERHRVMINPASILHMVQLRCLEGWLALSSGDLQSAAHLMEQAGRLGIESGFPFFEAMSSLCLMHVLVEEGKYSEAEEKASRGIRIAEEMESTHVRQMVYMALAFLHLKTCEDEKLSRSMGRFFSAGKEGGLFNAPMWRPKIISMLCARALEAGIEEEYVRELILRRELKPEGELYHLENWPWPLKIYTLGRFGLMINEESVRFSGKVQQRPLDMLKALISFGGRDVAVERFVDALWPELEGDAAHQAFNITLHRLRKLVGIKEAIELKEGKLSLNPEHCWVDIWAFERGFAAFESAAGNRFPCEALRTIELFGGIFLPNDESKSWTVHLREKTRNKYLRLIDQVGTHFTKRGQHDRARDCYLRALDLNPLSESLYRNLMICYEQMGQKGDVADVYERCRKVLAATFDVEPTRETKTIYNRIKS